MHIKYIDLAFNNLNNILISFLTNDNYTQNQTTAKAHYFENTLFGVPLSM